jgi:phosphonate transport system ATP-binding protein
LLKFKDRLKRDFVLDIKIASSFLFYKSFFLRGAISMIEFKNVHKQYQNGFVALKDINLQIGQGEFVAIIGLSGAGKSTLIRCINRMHDLTSGSLTVDEVEISTLKGKGVRELRRKIGMIFQSFNLVSRMTVIKNVLVSFVPQMPYWRKILGLFNEKEKKQALMALDRVGILEKAYQRADQLSGGQQQRVALARTLAQNPKIILADEPVASLDPVTANGVMEDFQRINQELNMTVIINIHHVELALQYAHRVIGIRAGEIVYDGRAQDVTAEILQQIYHGSMEEGGSLNHVGHEVATN